MDGHDGQKRVQEEISSTLSSLNSAQLDITLNFINEIDKSPKKKLFVSIEVAKSYFESIDNEV